MEVGQARDVASAWVASGPGREPGFVGALLTGSTLGRNPGQPLDPESDLDVVVVAERPPRALGKRSVPGVRLDVSWLDPAVLADPGTVARTHWLAPSFAGGGLLADPDGRLAAVERRVAPRFARPEQVAVRLDDVEARLRARLAEVPAARGWALQVLLWSFAASLPTQLVLVGALAQPTVRLRYLRARDVLGQRGRSGTYPGLLRLLGCATASAEQVGAHLGPMAAAFDAAAAVNRGGPGLGAGDVVPLLRPVAVDATAALVARGDHREAVFWLVATFARSLLVLEADAPAVAAGHRDAFAAAAATLLGLGGPPDLAARSAAVLDALPDLRAAADGLGPSS